MSASKRPKNGMSNARLNKLYFQHSMIFRPVLLQKNAYLQLMSSIIYRLDITLAAPPKNRLVFLMSAKKGRETTT